MRKVERGNVDRWLFGLLWRGKGGGKEGERMGKGRVEVLFGYEEKGEKCKSVGIRIMVTKE